MQPDPDASEWSQPLTELSAQVITEDTKAGELIVKGRQRPGSPRSTSVAARWRAPHARSLITGDTGEQNARSAEPILLEQTQFRFVAGTDGAESVQSVDQPDKFLHIDGSTVTLSTTATPWSAPR